MSLSNESPAAGNLNSDSEKHAMLDPIDDRLDSELEDRSRPPQSDPTSLKSARFQALTKILRAVGAIVLIASASTFLLQSWESGTDIQRYLTLLGLTAALSLVGFFCSLGIRENKAARTLLSLTLAFIPIHGAILGGLLYSRFAWDIRLGRIPQFSLWVAPSDLAALWTLAGAALVLLPLAYLSLLVLARRESKVMMAVLVAVNLPMLLPIRNPDVTALLIAGLTASLLFLELRWMAKRTSLDTGEGMVLRAILVAPILLLIGRSCLYHPTYLLWGAVLGSVSAALFLAARGTSAHRRQVPLLQDVSAIIALFAWSCIAMSLRDSHAIAVEALLPAIALPYSLVLVGMSIHGLRDGATYRRLAAIIAIAACSANLWMFPEVAASLLCLLAGILTLAYGFYTEQKLILISGILGAAFGLVHDLGFALEIYSWSRWGGLALLGVATIVAAAILERHHQRLVAATTAWARQFKTWDY